jgi:hypothetical protein
MNVAYIADIRKCKTGKRSTTYIQRFPHQNVSFGSHLVNEWMDKEVIKNMNFTKRSTAPSVPECHKVDPLSLDHVTYPSRFSFNMQDSDTSVTVSTAKDSDIFVTTSDDDS